jgi:methyl-accepting chemotaxis protein
MIGVAAAGVVVALVGTVAAWRLVGQIDDSATDGVAATLRTLDTVDGTIDLAERLVDGIDDTLEQVETGLDDVAMLAENSNVLVADVADLADQVAPGLRRATGTLRTLEGVGGTVDGFLGGVSRLPLAPEYDPRSGLGPTIGALADDLEPLATSFEETATSLRAVSEDSGRLQADLDALARSVATVSEQLDGSAALIVQYRSGTDEARRIALDARDDLAADRTLTRLLIVLGGLTFAAGQLVPFWVGRELVLEAGEEQEPTR